MEVASPTALLIHGWNDNPHAGWLGWLQSQLKARGFIVEAPTFSTDARPLLPRWQKQLQACARGLDERSLIVAHSLGALLTLRLLELLASEKQVGTVVLVSGFYDAPEARARRWFEPEPNWQKLKLQATRYICIYSDDDMIVTPDRTRRLAHHLAAELICLPGKGHFLGSRGLQTLPELIDVLVTRGIIPA